MTGDKGSTKKLRAGPRGRFRSLWLIAIMIAAAAAAACGVQTDGRAPGTALAAAIARPAPAGGVLGGTEDSIEHTRLIILHDNDLHFKINHAGEWRRVVGAMRSRYRNTLLLNAGDIFVRYPDRWAEPGSNEYYARRAGEMIDWMNRSGYDAAALGNHELAHKGELTGNALREAEFPLLSANVIADGEVFPHPDLYTIFITDDGIRVGVVGLTTVRDYTPQITAFDPIRIMGQHAALRDVVDVLLVVSHLGFEVDKQLARSYPFIDAIIGGHSHTELPTGHLESGVMIVQTGGHPHRPNPERAMSLGRVIFELEDRHVVSKCAEVLHIETSYVTFVPAPDTPWELRDECVVPYRGAQAFSGQAAGQELASP